MPTPAMRLPNRGEVLAVARLDISEAIRLGLVDDATLAMLARAGLLGGGAFSRGGGAQVPFWRFPQITRGGLQTTRFGLGPLSRGLALSPPAPAISGGGVPVGRRATGRSQAPPDLATLVGRGDIGTLAQRVREGALDPAILPPEIRQAVLQLVRQQAPPARPSVPGAPEAPAGAAELAVTKQVLSLAKQALDPNSLARKLLDAATPGQPTGLTPETADLAAQAEFGETGAEVPPLTGAERASLFEAVSRVNPALAQALTAPGAGLTPERLKALRGAGIFEPRDLTIRPGEAAPDVAGQTLQWAAGQGLNAQDAMALVQATQSGAVSLDEIQALTRLGYSSDDVMRLMGGAEQAIASAGQAPAFSLGGLSPSDIDLATAAEQGATGAAASSGLGQLAQFAGPALSYGTGVLNIVQTAMSDQPDINKALQAGSAAAGMIPGVGAAFKAALDTANTALSDLPNEQKAAYAALDAAATALAPATYGLSLVAAPIIKNLLKGVFGENKSRAQLDAESRAEQVTLANNYAKAVKAAKTPRELYDTIANFAPGQMGSGQDPVVSTFFNPGDFGAIPGPIGPPAAPAGGFAWPFEVTPGQKPRPTDTYPGASGVHIGQGPDPMEATLTYEQFLQAMQTPGAFEKLRVLVWAGPGQDPGINTALQTLVRGKVSEFNLREKIRPTLPSFSQMAGVVVGEDDVLDALKQSQRAGVEIGTPQFSDLLRTSERDRVARENYEATLQRYGGAEPSVQVPGSTVTRAAYGAGGPVGIPDEQAGIRRGYEASQAEAAAANPESYQPPAGGVEALFGEAERQQYGRPAEAGLLWTPGVGWHQPSGEVVYAAAPMAGPILWVPPPAPVAAEAPAPIPPPSPDAATAPSPEEEPEKPIGTLKTGGIVPRTGSYTLHKGEEVIPAEEVARLGGRYSLGEDSAPAGRPGVTPDAAPDVTPEGRWYLGTRRGVPTQADANPDPARTWRLAFDAEQLREAWKRRGTDGWPLLVPPSVVGRSDWPAVVERARQTQYQTLHPAVAMAREIGDDEQAVASRQFHEPPALAEDRFRRGMIPRRPAGPPLRRQPSMRPMAPDELRGIQWPRPTA